ncbi:MAG: DUF1800 domain-containing protein [Trueperaceae bacterium]
MNLSRRDFLRWSSLAAFLPSLQTRAVKAQTLDDPELSSQLHVLNRLTWGARPEDIVRIRDMGIEGYLEWQLDPDALDDPLVNGFLEENNVLLADEKEMRRAMDEDYDNLNRPALWSRLQRAIYSERQLFEKVVDFWTDHFNVPIPDLLVEKTLDDRDTIRPHALTTFRELLFASAKSPAMLIYLDNFNSHRDHPNENYARELMELHTLGVDGGYTEQDVREVARCFTGWTLRDNWDGRFFFDRHMHDEGEKIVLGVHIPAGRGIEDGLQVLDILATHPSTATFISKKLCRKFVSDGPEDSLVQAVAETFNDTGGDIKAMLRTIFYSEEFNSSKGQKFRRPMEAVVAMVRTLTPAVHIKDYWTLMYWLELMGQRPYHWYPPNGYPDVAGAWVNSNGLLHRWNSAMVLAHSSQGWTDGAITYDLNAVIPSATTVRELIAVTCQRLLGYELSPEDQNQLAYFVSDYGDPEQVIDDNLRNDRLPTLVGLILASPYFQWT